MEKFLITTESSRKPESKPTNVEHMQTRQANWALVYNNHDAGMIDGRTINGANAVVLELVYGKPESEKDGSSLQQGERAFDSIARTQRLYQDIVRQAAIDKTPLFLVDAHTDVAERMKEGHKEASKTQKGQMALSFLGGILGGMGALKLNDWADKAGQQKKMSRRNFLKIGSRTLGGLAAGAVLPSFAKYALPSQVYEKNSSNLQDDEARPLRQASKALEKTTDALYGDTYDTELRSIRSDLIAYRSRKVAELMRPSPSQDDNPNIAIVVGAHHHDIEKKLSEESEALQKELQTGLSKYQDLWGPEDEKIVRIDFIEVPGHPDQREIKLSIIDMPVS